MVSGGGKRGEHQYHTIFSKSFVCLFPIPSHMRTFLCEMDLVRARSGFLESCSPLHLLVPIQQVSFSFRELNIPEVHTLGFMFTRYCDRFHRLSSTLNRSALVFSGSGKFQWEIQT